MKQVRLGECTTTWQTLIEALERYVSEATGSKFATLDILRLEAAANEIAMKMDDLLKKDSVRDKVVDFEPPTPPATGG